MQETDSDDQSSNKESNYGEIIDIESSTQEENDEVKIERGKSRLQKKQKVKKECQAMKPNLTAMLWKLIPLGKVGILEDLLRMNGMCGNKPSS
ncbi:hypothetical protein O181_124219 [Austropuccinia psidii MF-1]|uniref:Uncharacterized protein n=1 Tax=Austropuccinia psidii MF-1 TaxID=1389203 RepID=A0A9Q3KNZ9_9BASI|nr:hypothetical protein [Austropuccinia psidii MF-1]